MNAVTTVGPPGPAPPATGTSPPAATGSPESAPFAQVLHGAGHVPPAPSSAAGEPPGPDPGSIDLAALIQLLLGGEPPGDHIEADIESQLDRLAGAGLTDTADTGLPVDGGMLTALASRPAPAAEEQASMQTASLPAAAAAGGPPAGRGRASFARHSLPASAADVARGAGARAGEAGPPPVILPSAAAGAPRSASSPVMVAEGEQQHALPLGKASVDVEAPAPMPVPAIEAEPPVTEPQQPIVDLPEVPPDEVILAPVVESEEPAPARPDPAARTGEATTEVVVAPASEPVTSSTRPTPVTAVEPAATPAAEAFTVDLANTVRRASLLGDREVRLLLNPPELGHLDFRIVASPEGLRVILEASTAEARELIERQLPMLRAALEARDLRVERLAVEQALEASSVEEDSDRGLREDGRGGDGSEQSSQDAAPWSPVASLQPDDLGQAAESGTGSSESESESQAVSDGRLDVLA